ncbi:MAG: DUF4190 domain-containing protein [Planctomycetota bacterium]|nr:DUF4190 domain-containing protein [Planctomycetota bacterium]
MAIETICKGCARKLRVGDEYAGRKARCPHCKTVYDVPAASNDGPFELSVGTSDLWLLRTKDGAVYGPASKSDLDGWVREGRIDAGSQVRMEGEATWRPASALYPSLLPKTAPNASPLASEPTYSAPVANPYTSPRAAGRSAGPYRPHRGGMILTFGIVGVLCCQIFSIAAWVMGHADMKEINAGSMDPEGRGLTQAGMIIGIVGTILFVLGTALLILFVAFAVIGGAMM